MGRDCRSALGGESPWPRSANFQVSKYVANVLWCDCRGGWEDSGNHDRFAPPPDSPLGCKAGRPWLIGASRVQGWKPVCGCTEICKLVPKCNGCCKTAAGCSGTGTRPPWLWAPQPPWGLGQMQSALAHLSLEARARDCARALCAGIRNPGALRARPASSGRGIWGSLSLGRTNPANRAPKAEAPEPWTSPLLASRSECFQ